MKMMKKGNDTQYVPDVFVESFKKNGYEICGEKKETAEPPKAPSVPPVTSDNQDDAQQNPDNSSANGEDDSSANTSDNQDDAQQNPDNSDDDNVHVCPYCDKEYAREGDLKNHIEKKHPAE